MTCAVMKTTAFARPALLCLLLAGSSQAAILLATDFAGTGSSVSAGTLSGFDYTVSNGLSGASIALTAGSLFPLNQNDSDSHFVPNIQVDFGQWTANLGMTVGASPVIIDSIDLERQNFNNVATFNTVTRDYPITVSLVGSISGTVATNTVDPPGNWSSANTTDNYSMGGVQINNSESWSIRIDVNDGTTVGGGVFVGIDQLTVNGSIVPEPSSFSLIGLGLGALCLTRRRL